MKKRKTLGSLVIIALLFISCTNPFFKDFLVSENSTTNPNKTNAEVPTISSHPQSNTVSINTVVELTILASVSDGGTLSYQWYSNNTNSNSGGTAITGATNSSYTVPTTSVGTTYYYCVVTNTNNNVNGDKIATKTSSVATITVKSNEGDGGFDIGF